MKHIWHILFAVGLGFLATQSNPALAQTCNGFFSANQFCGSVAGGFPGPVPFSSIPAVPAGTNGQLQYNNSGVMAGFTLSGDCTLAIPGIVCTKTNGVAFTTAATTSIGTSGATLGLLNANKTDSGNNTFSGTDNFTGTFQFGGNTMTFPGAAATLTQTIASGASAMGTGAISSATCATVVTASASGVLTTDTIQATFSADPTGTTGYIPATTGMLTIIHYPTANNVNFKVCNNTSNSITPGAVTINWRVVR